MSVSPSFEFDEISSLLGAATGFGGASGSGGELGRSRKEPRTQFRAAEPAGSASQNFLDRSVALAQARTAERTASSALLPLGGSPLGS